MQPTLKIIDTELTKRIVAEARRVLADIGVVIEDSPVACRLQDEGASLSADGKRVLLPEELVQRCLSSAPSAVALFDAAGRQTHDLGGDRLHFAPASSAITVLDGADGPSRPPTTADYRRYLKIVAGLPHLDAQSTAFVPADVAPDAADSYRLFLSLLGCAKPVITGAFGAESFTAMHRMLAARRGSEAELAAKPLAVFTCCPTSPLTWSAAPIRNLVDCATAAIPVEIVPVPLSGFIAPVTLAGTLIQATAENLAGVVIHQLAAPGAPLLWGSCNAIFDIRYETAPMGAIETMMLGVGSAAVGALLGLPTQAYIALSDAKAMDAQAGLETGMGAVLAALGGVNQVAGPGMLDFINCFSLHKLVLDHEIAAMVRRLREGITPREDFPARALFEELLVEQHLLIADHTRRHLKDEIRFPGPVIDRASRARWQEDGSQPLAARVAAELERLEDRYTGPEIGAELHRELVAIMGAEAARHGMDALPREALED